MEVLFDSEVVKAEYHRWLNYFGHHDPYETEETVGIVDVLRAHFLIVDYFYAQEYGLGGVGPREPDLLHSAVYRQFVSFEGKDKWPDPFHKAATLVFGIVNDHPFHDANKRTALLTLLYALHKMKRLPTVGEHDLEDLLVKTAEGDLSKYGRYRDISKKKDDADVLFIADFLKRNSRQLDGKYYTITYRELDRRLRDFGYCLANPRGNYIDVCEIEYRKRFYILGKKQEHTIRVAQIGFPSWKSQVGKGAISTVRRAAKLNPENGVDSASFYQGADALQSFVDQYSAPLLRLAYR